MSDAVMYVSDQKRKVVQVWNPSCKVAIITAHAAYFIGAGGAGGTHVGDIGCQKSN